MPPSELNQAQRGVFVALGVGAASLLALPALALDTTVEVACPELPAEPRAQVEARIRASLLLEDRGVEAVSVECGPEGASLRLDAGEAHLRRLVVRRGALEDDILQTLEQALQELTTPPAEPSAVPLRARPAEPSPPPLAPTPSPEPRVGKPAPLRPRPSVTELEVRALGERWSGNWAYGAQLGMSLGRPRLQYGLVVAGRVATSEPSAFELSEWSAAARLQLTLAELGGMRGSVSLGASLFVTAPTRGVVTDSRTLLAAPFAQLDVARPFWLGRVGIAPSVGARIFGGSRDVRVNGERAYELPFIAPQAAIVLLLRLPSDD